MIMLATTHEEQALPAAGAANVNERAAELLPRLLAERQAVGLERYGRPLETFNGRDVHRDALEEAIDLYQYLVQAQMEREALERQVDAMRPWIGGPQLSPDGWVALLDLCGAACRWVQRRDKWMHSRGNVEDMPAFGEILLAAQRVPGQVLDMLAEVGRHSAEAVR